MPPQNSSRTSLVRDCIHWEASLKKIAESLIMGRHHVSSKKRVETRESFFHPSSAHVLLVLTEVQIIVFKKIKLEFSCHQSTLGVSRF